MENILKRLKKEKLDIKRGNSMDIIKTEIDDVLILEPRVFGDHRGWFTETYSKTNSSKF